MAQLIASALPAAPSAGAAPVARLHEVQLRYGKTTALDGVTLTSRRA